MPSDCCGFVFMSQRKTRDTLLYRHHARLTFLNQFAQGKGYCSVTALKIVYRPTTNSRKQLRPRMLNRKLTAKKKTFRNAVCNKTEAAAVERRQ